MTCLQLLVFLCWCSSIFAVTSCFRVDGYSCVSTYWKSITCVLNITSNPAGPPDTNFSLKFFNNKARTETTCPLVLMNNTYTCVCKVTEFNLHHTDVLSIQLCNDSSCLYLMRSFKPSMNIQLMPPHDVEVNDTSEHVNITWKSGYEQHRYLSNRLDYELLLQKPHSSWSQTLKPRQTFESIPKSRFDRFDMDATYCIKVRSKPLGSGYNGTWSEWSPVTCWKNDAQIVQLTPPHDVEVNDTSEHVNITWKSGYEQHRYLSNRLDYELLLQKPHSSWSQTLKPRQTFESIPKSSFDTDATYCIKVRSKPLGSGYNGTWSEWSPVTCWKNDVQIEPLSLLVILTRSLGPVCVIVGVALFMFYSPAAR
ncbi:hypothetical protein INR49_002004 [Caranx melampygus]|nr:hypothetical protein INR49_002004 [Caranx melampygus]